MIWKTKTHEFSATLCQKTGKTCPALAQMARAIVQAMESAIPATSDDFEFEGSAELAHCPQGCAVRYRANRDQILMFGGAEADAPIDALEDYAEMLFGPEFTTRPAQMLPTPPCAMLQVSKLATGAAVRPEQRVAL